MRLRAILTFTCALSINSVAGAFDFDDCARVARYLKNAAEEAESAQQQYENAKSEYESACSSYGYARATLLRVDNSATIEITSIWLETS